MTDSNGLLRKWIDFGIDYRIATNPKFADRWFANEDDYLARIQHEYTVITDKDFADYFLVCSDIVRWAKDVDKQAVGPGRGSAAGSLLCYLLRITEIDPMTNQLMMFERFIDPSRPDMPDIDMDFARPIRVFQYAQQKYGVDKVSHIGNFMRWRGRAAVKDIGRVYQIDPAEYEPLKKLIVDRPDGDPRENDSVEDTLDAFAEAQAVLDAHPEFQYAPLLEGNYRNLGMHAAGIVISNDPIEDTCAVYTKERKGKAAEDDELVSTVIAYDKRDAEYLDMLKLDALGLSTMAVIGDAIEMINDPELTMESFYTMDLEELDAKTAEGFRNVDLTGIFQFDGRTTRGITKNIYEGTEHPIQFLTLADINALSRPGALISGMTGRYEKVERGRAKPQRHHPVVAEILAPTHGCLVYQEQVMRIGALVGGFPGEKVGALRKIIGKKKAGGAFEEFFVEFAAGAKRLHDIDEAEARQLWDWMAASASYLFNIAHAYAYAMIAYWTMFLKVNYPAEFYAASLRYARKTDRRDLPLELMQDSVRHSIEIKPPTLTSATLTWTAHKGFGKKFQPKNYVRAGMLQLPDVGPSLAPKILAYQYETGEYRWDQLRYVAPRYRTVRVPSAPWWEEVTKFRTVHSETGETTKERYRTKVLRDYRREKEVSVPARGVAGLGGGKLTKILEFVNHPDPFGIRAATNACQHVIKAIAGGDVPLPPPTADAHWLGNRKAYDSDVVFIGLIREVRIIDVIEAERKRTNQSADKIRAALERPELTTKAKVIAHDHTGAEVHINVDRYRYPELAEDLRDAVAKRDVIHVQGTCREAYGPTVQAKHLVVIELEEQ